MIARSPETVAAAVRAIVKTQAALKANVSRATEVGNKLFPPEEAGLIAELIRRDLPYYDATLSREFVAGMTAFLRSQGVLDGDVSLRRRRRDAIRPAVEGLTHFSNIGWTRPARPQVAFGAKRTWTGRRNSLDRSCLTHF